MTVPVFWRDLAAVARSSRLLATAVLHLTVVAVFLLIWGDGLPVLRDYAVLQQLVRVDVVLLSLVLPWAALRCSPADGPDGLARLAVATSGRPSLVIVEKAGALAVALGAITLSATPFLLVAQQISALPPWSIAEALAPLVAVSMLSAVAATGASLLVVGRLSAWLAATMTTVTVAAFVSPTVQGTAQMLIVAAAGVFVLSLQADRRWRYLAEAFDD